jgi:hypothetical protein
MGFMVWSGTAANLKDVEEDEYSLSKFTLKNYVPETQVNQ